MKKFKLGFFVICGLVLGACSSVSDSPLVGVDPALSGGKDWKFSAEGIEGMLVDTIKVFVTDNGEKTELGTVDLSMSKRNGVIEKDYKGKHITAQCRALDEGGSSVDSCIIYINGKRGPKLRL